MIMSESTQSDIIFLVSYIYAVWYIPHPVFWLLINIYIERERVHCSLVCVPDPNFSLGCRLTVPKPLAKFCNGELWANFSLLKLERQIRAANSLFLGAKGSFGDLLREWGLPELPKGKTKAKIKLWPA